MIHMFLTYCTAHFPGIYILTYSLMTKAQLLNPKVEKRVLKVNKKKKISKFRFCNLCYQQCIIANNLDLHRKNLDERYE